VAQDETYAQVIERKTGLKVLNAAISSYGTAREMRLLNRIDTSNLEYLIIHHSYNDYYENKAFLESGNQLKISSRETYEKVQRLYLGRKRYFPGKYTYRVLRWGGGVLKYGLISFARRLTDGEATDDFITEDEAGIFFETLLNAGATGLEGFKIIILGESNFTAALEKILRSERYSGLGLEVITVSFDNEPGGPFSYILDDHPNAKGHRAIAENLLRYML